MTRALYEVTSQEGCLLTVADDDEQPVAVVEVAYYGNQRQPSVDGVAVRAVYKTDGKTRIRPSEDYTFWNDAFDAGSAYLKSPSCDYDAIADALCLTFVNAYARDSGR